MTEKAALFFEVLNYLAFVHNKLTRLSVLLSVDGEDTADVDKGRNRLNTEIRKLRTDIVKQWNGLAGNVMRDLRGLNDRAQAIIRDLDSAANKTEQVTKVLGFLIRV